MEYPNEGAVVVDVVLPAPVTAPLPDSVTTAAPEALHIEAMQVRATPAVPTDYNTDRSPLEPPPRDQSITPLPVAAEIPNLLSADAVAIPIALALSATPLAAQTPVMSLPRTVDTRFGGIFYLLNVTLALGLYGDFTQPRKPGIALSPWDLLALVGRSWFGHAFDSDPVWAFLAELSGRAPQVPPGIDFAAPETWLMPEDWLAPWGETETLAVYATRKRLQIWHGAGFSLLDVPRIEGLGPLAHARALCADYAPCRATPLVRMRKLMRRSNKNSGPRGDVARWLQWLTHYLQARLMRALGTDEEGAIASIVCRHSARIAHTATTLDVYLSLQELPLELRIAGLDRDPGWIPAAGRSVAFHFQ